MTWTSCKEKLPERSGRYLVTRMITPTAPVIEIMKFASNLYLVSESSFYDKKGVPGWYDRDFGPGYSIYFAIDDGSITAWMELPEPYEEDANAHS